MKFLSALLVHLLVLLLHFAAPSAAVSACDINEERATRRMCDDLICDTAWLQAPKNATRAILTFCMHGWREHFHCNNCRNIPGFTEPAQCCQIAEERRAGCFARMARKQKGCTKGPNVDLDTAKWPILLETEPPIPDVVDEEVEAAVRARNQRVLFFVVIFVVGVLAIVKFSPARVQQFRASMKS